MSTYVISDVHGHYGAFIDMLDLIGMSSNDTLWVLGDIIDRGPNSVEMLRFAAENARKYENIHFLIGNHEQMMLDSIALASKRRTTFWTEHEGRSTIAEINDARLDADWIDEILYPWLCCLPYYKHIKVNNNDYMLVHAGFSPSSYTLRRNDETVQKVNATRNALNLPYDRYDHGLSMHDGFGNDPILMLDGLDIEVGNGFGKQKLQDLLWIRSEWMLDNANAPMTTIHGHTMTAKFAWNLDALEATIGARCTLSDGGIFRYRNKIDIDCGAGANHMLGCIRLDDNEEFYIKII